MNLINNKNFNIITQDNNCSNFSKLEYSKISDNLLLEITSKYYDAGETDIDILIDLKLVTSFEVIEANNLFNEVTKLHFKDREQAIVDYNNKILNDSFYNFKNKIFVFDQKVFLEHSIEFEKFFKEVASAEKAGKSKLIEKVIVMNEETQQLRTEIEVFIDYVNVAEMEYIKTLKCFKDDGITERNLVELTSNPTKEEDTNTAEIIIE